MQAPEALADAGRKDFGIEVRVYYHDTDAGGVVYHASYLNFFERARTEWLRALGCDVGRLAQAGCLFIVRRMQLRYLRPALLDDRLRVTVAVERVGRAQITLLQRAMRGTEDLVETSVNLACVDGRSFRPIALPEGLFARLGPDTAQT